MKKINLYIMSVELMSRAVILIWLSYFISNDKIVGSIEGHVVLAIIFFLWWFNPIIELFTKGGKAAQ